jgi:acylphosphatase
MKVRAHLFVSGKVQGVFFRSYTQREANRRTVEGWIRNHKDGRVEAVLEGEEEDVKAVIEYCRKGPSFAGVKDVNVRWEVYKGEFHGFNVRYF